MPDATYFGKLLVGRPPDEFSANLMKMPRCLSNSGHTN